MFSNAERCRYGKPQLLEVLCQLRFPAILKIENQSPYEFQELIRKDYPNYSFKEEHPPAKPNTKPMTVKNHQFISLDGGWKVNLTRDASPPAAATLATDERTAYTAPWNGDQLVR